MSSAWKFAERRALVEFNPWQGQSLPKAKAAAEGTQKRPYTNDELAKLLASGDASPMLKDAMMLLALSGMRTEELARLKVGDLRDLKGKLPYIALRGTKTHRCRARRSHSPRRAADHQAARGREGGGRIPVR